MRNTRSAVQDPALGNNHAHPQIKDHLHRSLYQQILGTYKQRSILVFVIVTGLSIAIASPMESLRNGLSWNHPYLYYIWLIDSTSFPLTAFIIGLGIRLLFTSVSEEKRVSAGLEYLIKVQPKPLSLITTKTVATAGSTAGQTRTILALFLLGTAVSLFGKGTIEYVAKPMSVATVDTMPGYLTFGSIAIGYSIVIAIIGAIIVEIQKASFDTDILKAIAYYEEYLAEEATKPAPAPTPAPAAKPTPSAAKPASHGQQSQPKQTTQAQRKNKRR